jgi:hypothetical protein
VFDNRVLRRIFGLRNLYSSSNIVRVIRSRIMKWAVQVACIDGARCVHQVCLGSLRGRDRWGDLDVDGRIMSGGIYGR